MSGKTKQAILGPLGVGEEEEIVYRLLLGKPGSSLDNLCNESGLQREQTRSALRGLENKALVVRTSGRPRRWSVAPPDVALQDLLHKRRQELENAGAEAGELIEQLFNPSSTDPADLLELVVGRDAVAHKTFQLMYNAQNEVLILSKLPFMVPIGESTAELSRRNLERGVSYRVIYEYEALSSPDDLATIRDQVRAGQLARVSPRLPMKLVVSDGRAATTIMTGESPEAPTAAVIKPSPLLDGLLELFEALWERAVPLSLTHEPIASRVEDQLSEIDRELIALMATGMKDDAIGLRLGVTSRSVRRRLTRMMSDVHAETRFQLALEAAWRGWIASR